MTFWSAWWVPLVLAAPLWALAYLVWTRERRIVARRARKSN